MKHIDQLKRFVFDGLLAIDTFDSLEEQGISVRSAGDVVEVQRIEEADYSPRIIFDAKNMASIFVVFFCLENSVRELITDRLAERHGVDWWETCVPKQIRNAVEKLKVKEEKNRYHTQRSTALIGYTLFGNLEQIIISKWEDFSDLFPSQSWVTSRFTDLEMSRNIIMHTGTLPAIEIDRIESIARDWVRQVG